MYFWLTFVVGFSIYASETGVVLGDAMFKDEVRDLKAFNDGMKRFPGLKGLLAETEPYVDALYKIDKMWHSDFFTSKTWVQFSVELIKKREFTERFQCSQATLTYAYITFLASSMDSPVNWKNDMRPKVIAVSNAFGDTVPKLMAVLSHLEITPPKWMVMTSIFTYGIRQKAERSEDDFKNAISSYLRDTARRITSELVAYGGWCRDYLEDADPARTLMAMEHQEIINKLDALAISITKAVEQELKLLDQASFTSFEFKQWMLMDVGETENSLNVFMPGNNEFKELNILWDKLRPLIVSKFDEIKSYTAQKTNWMLKMYETKISTQDNVQFLLKNVYLTVVLKYILLIVTYCDNMKMQFEQSPLWLKQKEHTLRINDVRGEWKIMCEPIINVVTEAIEFLGTGTVLEGLLPHINTFVDAFGEKTSTIMIKVTSSLQNISGKLRIEASGHIEPLPIVESKKITYDLKKDFPMVPEAFKRAVQYTRNIKQTFPNVNFKVIDFIISSV